VTGLTRARGFTLIELLVVMAIISMLVGLGVTMIPYMRRRGERVAAETFISTLSAALQAYQGGEGAFPPTSLNDFPGVGTLSNNENLGIESVVVCLNSVRYGGSFDFTGTKGATLDNLDGDQTQVQLTRFGARDMFEALDPWGTPYVYFKASDYARAEDLGRVTGGEGTIKALPWKDTKTKTWARYDTYQIISAGPDRIFNTEDDITNFERE
jgi:prepilin-type N-terminal cleavage/methylation domain-containing protein